MNARHKVFVKNGKFQWADRERLVKDLLSYEGKEAFISISGARRDRSDDQNRYYWGVVLKIISNETGSDSEDLHEFFKQEFLSKRFKIGNEITNISSSTAKLSTREFESYLESIRMFVAQRLEIQIPLPNEVNY